MTHPMNDRRGARSPEPEKRTLVRKGRVLLGAAAGLVAVGFSGCEHPLGPPIYPGDCFTEQCDAGLPDGGNPDGG
jgi:hypothetical protein